MPIADNECFTNFKNRGNLKFVSLFHCLYLIQYYLLKNVTKHIPQTINTDKQNNNFNKGIILKVQKQFSA